MDFRRLRLGTLSTIISTNSAEKTRPYHSSLIHHCFLIYILRVPTCTHFMKTLRGWISTWGTKIYSGQIPHAMSIFFRLFKLQLLENVVSSTFSLQLLQYQVICRSNLIMLVVLDEDCCLIIKIRICYRKERMISNLSCG